MSFLKNIVLFAALFACSFPILGIESSEFPPVEIKTEGAEQFCFPLSSGGGKEINEYKTKSLKTIGLADFLVVNQEGHVMKVCKTNRKNITHANFSPNGQFIITTSADGFVDIWKDDCKRFMSIYDESDGIRLGIFADDDRFVVTFSKSDNSLRKVWMLPTYTLLYWSFLSPPLDSDTRFYLYLISELIGQKKGAITYDYLIKYFVNKCSSFIRTEQDENMAFNRLDIDTQIYLRARIPGRPGPVSRCRPQAKARL